MLADNLVITHALFMNLEKRNTYMADQATTIRTFFDKKPLKRTTQTKDIDMHGLEVYFEKRM